MSVQLYDFTSDIKETLKEKSFRAITKGSCGLLWTNPESITPQNNNCTATQVPSYKRLQVRRARYAVLCWRSKEKLVSDAFRLTSIQGIITVSRSEKNLQSSALFEYQVPFTWLSNGDSQWGRMSREFQGNPCCHHARWWFELGSPIRFISTIIILLKVSPLFLIFWIFA